MESSRVQATGSSDDSNLYQIVLEKLDELSAKRQIGYLGDKRINKVTDCSKFLRRIGVTQDRLDELSCIHVTGTKGKGSTCAFTEKILRTCGVKTGMFTSPPLVEVRERIRINGAALPREVFAKYALKVYDILDRTKDNEEEDGPVGKMPVFFQFMTILSFYIFLEEKVEVALIEVGRGGEYDCTNVLRVPAVVGIGTLGLEHTEELGDTLEKIAWQKSGICKHGRPAFTVPQLSGPLEVISERAKEKGASIKICPNLADYGFRGNAIQLGLIGKYQRINASLALQMARTWLEEKRPGNFTFSAPVPSSELPPRDDDRSTEDPRFSNDEIVPTASPFVLPDIFIEALKTCRWAGRTQVMKREGATYYLDMAHTKDSIELCGEWFKDMAAKEEKEINTNVTRVLMFSMFRSKNAWEALSPLVGLGFDAVVFCPGRARWDVLDEAVGRMFGNLQRTPEFDLETSKIHRNCYEKLLEATKTKNGSSSGQKPVLKVLSSITEAVQWIRGSAEPLAEEWTSHAPPLTDHLKIPDGHHLQVLVTGATHLVGGFIKIMDPSLAVDAL